MENKEEQKKKPQMASSATVAAAATFAINLHFAPLIAAMANLQNEE
jgi:hypothetical protein